MLNLTVIASSGESVAAASCVRRNVFSTSSRVIDRPSTVAHVSAETGTGFGLLQPAVSAHQHQDAERRKKPTGTEGERIAAVHQPRLHQPRYFGDSEA